MSPDYYVYMFIRSADSSAGPAGSPYYIGKGKGQRAFDRKRSGMRPPNDRRYITICSSCLTEEQAFDKEIELISHYGRVDLGTGILRNRTNGGEGVAGATWKRSPRTEEHKARLSAALKGKGHPQLEETKKKIAGTLTGRSRPLEVVQKISNSKVGKSCSPSTEFKKGHVMTTEQRETWLRSQRSRGPRKPHTEEAKRKMSAALKGRKPSFGMLGKKRTTESRGKASASLLEAFAIRRSIGISEEEHARRSEAAKAIWAKRKGAN